MLPTGLGLLLGSLLFPDRASRQEAIRAFLGGLTEHRVPEQPEERQREDVAVAMRVIGSICVFLGTVLGGASWWTAGWAEAKVSILAGVFLVAGGAAVWIVQARDSGVHAEPRTG